ncbi:Xylose isomerase-like TIM barrel [Anatilimnocola aggregata]|uniref:Xylose isomerase-like TIM barrel n=1 Tax=Anatilimnocola aggregata TaxID=2528021 RepID=A0A517YE27_9BACT|nr:TIM barrel protein [Anatilimnocola aggregata]QDU28483.1 Xylose isomerase-like TIM barrel [Anatilimnocola aggregata]
MTTFSRRQFVQASAALTAGGLLAKGFANSAQAAEKAPAANKEDAALAFGLVTYMWGADWDVPTLLENCKKSQVLGVELRTTHAHKVEPTLNEQQRGEVQAKFADAGVTIVGIGSNERYDHPDPAKLKAAIDATKDFIRLSHDIGGSGVKVKPDTFHKDIPHEKTIEQIGKTLNELGEYATGFGQQIRLEVHGQCAELPTIKAIMDIATDENVFVCWNSNPTDLKGDGLVHNFNLVRKRFGSTVHIHELESKEYPHADLFKLLVDSGYVGWLLLEAASKPADRVAALTEQKKLFDQMVAKAKA